MRLTILTLLLSLLVAIVGATSAQAEGPIVTNGDLRMFVIDGGDQAVIALASLPACSEKTTRRFWGTLMSITSHEDPRLQIQSRHQSASDTSRIRWFLIQMLDSWRAGQDEGYPLPSRVGAVEHGKRILLWVGRSPEGSKELNIFDLFEFRGDAVMQHATADYRIGPVPWQATAVCQYRLTP